MFECAKSVLQVGSRFFWENNRSSPGYAFLPDAWQNGLVRFGYEWFDEFCKRHNCEIIIINAESLSPEEEVTKDLLTIIHGFSLRLYGLRRYKKDVEKIVTSHEND